LNLKKAEEIYFSGILEFIAHMYNLLWI